MTEETVDGYISAAPPAVAEILTRVRVTIREALPGSGESISYHMPTVTLGDDRHVTFYAGWKSHVALYAVYPFEDDELERQVAPYRSGKDTLKFPVSKPVPYDLVAQVVRRLAEMHRERQE